MSFLRNAGIRTKILSLIIPICLLGIAGVLVVANNYKQGDTDYSDFIATDNVAAIEMARASQRITATSYSAYQILVYDADAAVMPQLQAEYKDNTQKL